MRIDDLYDGWAAEAAIGVRMIHIHWKEIDIEISDKTPIWQIRGLSLCSYFDDDIRELLLALVTAYDAQNKAYDGKPNWQMHKE